MRANKLVSITAVAIALAFLVAAAACGGSPDGGAGGGTPAATQEISVNWGTEPPSLDPGLATDTTSANILLNVMDPLVKLGADLEPTASLAVCRQLRGSANTSRFSR